jgi:hypothetical protein
MKKICPKCFAEFECNPEEIEICNCSKINLSIEIKELINKNYNDCLCLECLKKLISE